MQKPIRSLASLLASASLLCVGAAAQAPGSFIATGFTSSSVSARSNYFDVVNVHPTNPVVISAITQYAGTGNPMAGGSATYTYAIYTKVGTWVGFEHNAAAWTLVGTVPVVMNLGSALLLAYLPLPSNVTIPAGARSAFYIHALSGATPFVPGTSLGAPIASDAFLQVLEGGATPFTAAAPAPFAGALSVGTASSTARWQGYLYYGPPTGAVWQANQPAAGFDVDGVAGTSTTKAVVVRAVDNLCTFNTAVANVQSTNVGFPWDLGITTPHAHPSDGGGFVTAGGQKANLLIADPSFQFLNGLTFTYAMPAASLALPASFPVPFTAAGQVIVLDPVLVDGFALSAPVDLDFVAAPPTPPPPSAQNTAATYSFAAVGGFCTLPFFGTTFTEFSVSSNGRVTFGGQSTSASPSVAAAMTGPGTAGAWTALITATPPSPTGAVTITSPATGVVHVGWNNFIYATGGFTGFNSFSVELDANTGNITVAGLNTLVGWVPNYFSPPNAGRMFLGLSQGAGATDAGQVIAGLGFFPGPPAATDMLYRFGTAGTLAPGLMRVVFSPSATVIGNYDLTGF